MERLPPVKPLLSPGSLLGSHPMDSRQTWSPILRSITWRPLRCRMEAGPSGGDVLRSNTVPFPRLRLPSGRSTYMDSPAAARSSTRESAAPGLGLRRRERLPRRKAPCGYWDLSGAGRRARRSSQPVVNWHRRSGETEDGRSYRRYRRMPMPPDKRWLHCAKAASSNLSRPVSIAAWSTCSARRSRTDLGTSEAGHYPCSRYLRVASRTAATNGSPPPAQVGPLWRSRLPSVEAPCFQGLRRLGKAGNL